MAATTTMMLCASLESDYQLEAVATHCNIVRPQWAAVTYWLLRHHEGAFIFFTSSIVTAGRFDTQAVTAALANLCCSLPPGAATTAGLQQCSDLKSHELPAMSHHRSVVLHIGVVTPIAAS